MAFWRFMPRYRGARKQPHRRRFRPGMFPFDQTLQAHRYRESNQQFGEIEVTAGRWHSTGRQSSIGQRNFTPAQ
jgi:hypothetical protein